MIAVDTNVIVRFLVEDDDLQTKKAARLIQGTIESGEALFVSDVVMCEIVWVLTVSYGFTRREITAVLEQLIKARHLVFSASDQLVVALASFASGKGDFADYVIRQHARAAGFDHVATFDRGLLKEPGFLAV